MTDLLLLSAAILILVAITSRGMKTPWSKEDE